ncbi:hypothetical protein GGR56DRAFT_68971 [Xylariaceae sp. FL0804]|nr:hypothetical protein GGR56DRAFT_68971 [Xylariaceae sp. FL0804]
MDHRTMTTIRWRAYSAFSFSASSRPCVLRRPQPGWLQVRGCLVDMVEECGAPCREGRSGFPAVLSELLRDRKQLLLGEHPESSPPYAHHTTRPEQAKPEEDEEEDLLSAFSFTLVNGLTRVKKPDGNWDYRRVTREQARRRFARLEGLGPLNGWDGLDEELRGYVYNIWDGAFERRFAVTGNKYMGLGPWYMKPGDHVVVLAGGSMPYVVRPVACGDDAASGGMQESRFRILGNCYVHGLMHGEVSGLMSKGGLQEREFILE